MRHSIRGRSAILGSALVALSLCGSAWRPFTIAKPIGKPNSPAATVHYDEGLRLYRAGEYTRASQEFRNAALRAQRDGSLHQAAMNWNNAGGAELARLDYRDALSDFLKARPIADASGLRPVLMTATNLAGLYLQMGDPAAALLVAQDALRAGRSNISIGEPDASPPLRFQLATALARLHRFDEALPIFRRAIGEIAEHDDFDATARMLGDFAGDCLEAGRLADAEEALSRALLLVRLHRLDAEANILRVLAKLKNRQGDLRSAAALFDAAIQSPQSMTPRWQIYADRGEFRLSGNDLRDALADFREARRLASQIRADIVPADQDRIALEGGLSRVSAGLVEAGNRLAQQDAGNRLAQQDAGNRLAQQDAGNRLAQRTPGAGLLRETFDTAEQDRLWSLRALVPEPNDWRTRLPDRYWDLLARYQAIERTLVATPSAEPERQAAVFQAELRQIESAAATGPDSGRTDMESAFTHASRVLDADSVLLSFHVTKTSGWLWALDQHGVDVYAIPRADTLQAAVAEFAHATQQGDDRAADLGRCLYLQLFGQVADRYLSHKRWLLEPDGPLFDLPFAALVVNSEKADSEKADSAAEKSARKNEPIYLFERTVLQAIPGALMLEPRKAFGNGSFLGIGDPIYSPADARYQGDRTKHEVVLPRLPGTAGELEACSRAWNPAKSQLLTGTDAVLTTVRTALHSNPAVIHFATHVLTAPGNYSSGLIALSLDRSGGMGFIGPADIAAYTISPSLVVLNGCHSGQGESLPGAGLMGLTRAWIGAGARSVLATRWDIPDEAGAAMVVEFYQALRANPERGPAFALRQAQSRFRQSHASAHSPAVWSAYFVLGRE